VLVAQRNDYSAPECSEVFDRHLALTPARIALVMRAAGKSVYRQITRIAIGRGFPGKNASNTAPMLEFVFFDFTVAAPLAC